MIQAEIGHDAIDPSVKGALEAETREIDVCPKERFLINVLTILLRAREMHRQPQHGTVVLPHQFFEGRGVPLLRLANQRGVVNANRYRRIGGFQRGQYRAVQVRRFPNFAGLRHNHLRLSVRPLSNKLVARAMHGEDEARLLWPGLNLLPQTDDVRIHGASRREADITPNIFEQAITAESLAGMAKKIFEKLELLGGKLEFLSQTRILATLHIDL